MTEPRLLEALARLNQVGLAINRLDTGDLASIQTMLRMIVESAREVVPGSSAVIYTFDETSASFHNDSRVSAERNQMPGLDDSPRPDGLGARSVARRRRVLSYEENDLAINPAKVAMGACAMACFPLIVASEVLGVLYVYLHEQRSFSKLELLMLDNFVNQAGMTLSLARQFVLAQQEQVRKDRELRRLRRAGMLISSRSNLKGTLDAILQVALEITDAVYGIFRLVDPVGKNLVTQAISGIGLNQPAVETLAIDDHSVMGLVALRREPVIIDDLRNEPWTHIYYPFDRELEMRSELAVPLIGASGRLEGVLNLESPQVNGFDRQDRYILQILATQAVVAVQEARLLDALQEISLMLPRYAPQRIHQTLVKQACDLLNVPYGMIWLLENDQLVLQASTGPGLNGFPIGDDFVDTKHNARIERMAAGDDLSGSAQPAAPTRLSLNTGLAGRAVMEARPVTAFVEGAPGSMPVTEYPDLPFFRGRGSALSVPLFATPDGQPVGSFTVYTSSGDLRDFDHSDWDIKVLDILGHYAALAEQLAAQQEALRVAQDQRALTEAFAAIGDIAANLLHRLNNKIGTIPVRVEGIQDKCADLIDADAYLDKNLAEIQRSASEAMEVVRESVFHLHPIQLAPVSVLGSVREAISGSRLPAEVEVVVEGLDLLPPVQAGPKRLAFVFSNLFENAADALGGQGIIHVSGSATGGWVHVEVSDNGPGIAPELHERIFEFNYSSRSSAHPGKLGFGLWWVKSLMARFGGSVTVKSDGKTGTSFTLRLPQVQHLESGQFE